MKKDKVVVMNNSNVRIPNAEKWHGGSSLHTMPSPYYSISHYPPIGSSAKIGPLDFEELFSPSPPLTATADATTA